MPHRAYALTLVLLATLVAGAWALPDKSSRDDGATITPLKTERTQPAAAASHAGSGTVVPGGARGGDTVAGV